MLVELRDVSRRFGKVRALDHVELTLPTGSRTALIGPNGSGKSTLTRALLGLIRCEGEILLDGSARDLDDAQAGGRIAYVPQVAPRIAATVGDLVAGICELRERPTEPVEAIADALGLSLERVSREPLRALSGGMRQKALAALALGSGAELLVLDEPTASLDPSSRRAFFAAVEDLPDTVTILLCSHRLDEIRSLVDRVAVLDEGHLRYVGPADEFLRARSTSVVEARVAGPDGSGLEGLGFRRGATGWWSRTVATDQRAALVRQVVGVAGDALVDVLVTDLEDLRIEAPASTPVPRVS